MVTLGKVVTLFRSSLESFQSPLRALRMIDCTVIEILKQFEPISHFKCLQNALLKIKLCLALKGSHNSSEELLSELLKNLANQKWVQESLDCDSNFCNSSLVT